MNHQRTHQNPMFSETKSKTRSQTRSDQTRIQEPFGHLNFYTVYPLSCLKAHHTPHFISRTFLGQFGLVFFFSEANGANIHAITIFAENKNDVFWQTKIHFPPNNAKFVGFFLMSYSVINQLP